MLKIQEIRELIKLIDQSTIDEFKFEQNGAKVTIRKHGNNQKNQVVEQPVIAPVFSPPVPPVVTTESQTSAVSTESTETKLVEATEEKAAKADKENYYTIKSPMVGTFYVAPSPDSPPYVKVGDKVTEESIVCIVEAMKLMNEIEAEVNGEIVEVLAKNGQLVEYGQELFLVKPE